MWLAGLDPNDYTVRMLKMHHQFSKVLPFFSKYTVDQVIAILLFTILSFPQEP